MANHDSSSITEYYILDTLTQSGSVREHVEQVDKSNENVSWVLIGATPAKREGICRSLIMQVVQSGNVWGELLELLVENRIFYCFIKFECSNLKGISKSFLIHWIGEKVPKEEFDLCKSHINKIENIIRGSYITIVSSSHTSLDNEIMTTLTNYNQTYIAAVETDIKISELEPIENIHSSYTVEFKMCIIGNSDVGKSSILKSFNVGGRGLNKMETPESTVAFGFFFHCFFIPNTNINCKVTIWDTGGSERFKSMSIMSFRNSHVVVMVYDISDLESFDAIPIWYAQAKKHVDDRAIFMLVGNKLDLHERREVQQKTAQIYAKKNGFEYFECSTTQGSNIFHLFNQIEKSIKQVYPDKLEKPKSVESIQLSLPSDRPRKSGCCSLLRRKSSSIN